MPCSPLQRLALTVAQTNREGDFVLALSNNNPQAAAHQFHQTVAPRASETTL